MGCVRPPCPAEFRAEAVRLARSTDRSVPQLARELGVSPQTLTNWIAQERIHAGKLPGLTSDERARLAELEREVRILARSARSCEKQPASSRRRR